MIQTVEAVVDANGRVRLLGEVRVDAPRRALVTVLEEPAAVPGEAALLAESGFGRRLVEAGGGCGVVVPSAGEVVLVPFPFSDLSQSKLRPAVCLADAGRGDWVLCQITGSPYGDPSAVPLEAADFSSGGLLVASFARPGKLFTASSGLFVRSVGTLSPAALGPAYSRRSLHSSSHHRVPDG